MSYELKRSLLACATLFLQVSLSFSQQLRVYTTDGNYTAFPVETVDYITVVDDTDNPPADDNQTLGVLGFSGTTLTLTDPTARIGTQSVSIDLSTLELPNASEVAPLTLSDGSVITFAQATGSAAPKYYTATAGVRVYACNTITISAPRRIAYVSMLCDDAGGTIHSGNATATVEFTGNTLVYTNAFSTNSGGTQLRVKTLTIVYHDANGSQPDVDDNNHNANSTVTCQYADRLEFPHLSDRNAMTLVHTTSDSYDAQGINYAIEWDTQKKSQRWTCYQMKQGYVVSGVSRYTPGEGELQYPYDPQLTKGGTYWDRDYFSGSGYDHGHICPSADRLYSDEANKQTFYLSNMMPQTHSFNAGIWERLENKVRAWTNISTTEVVYVCKGGLIDNEEDIHERISGKLIVPKYFFTAVLKKTTTGKYSAVAVLLDQTDTANTTDLKSHAMSIDELEQRTGIDFFCNLPDNIEEQVEKTYTPNEWSF